MANWHFVSQHEVGVMGVGKSDGVRTVSGTNRLLLSYLSFKEFYMKSE
jgi:hypothetical protein